jgi:hypothetical protein
VREAAPLCAFAVAVTSPFARNIVPSSWLATSLTAWQATRTPQPRTTHDTSDDQVLQFMYISFVQLLLISLFIYANYIFNQCLICFCTQLWCFRLRLFWNSTLGFRSESHTLQLVRHLGNLLVVFF